MKIEILGTGCTKCKALEKVAREAVAKIGGFHEVKKVEDIVDIMNYGVMSTPALAIDGVVKSSGKLLSVEEVIALMNGSQEELITKSNCGCGGKC